MAEEHKQAALKERLQDTPLIEMPAGFPYKDPDSGEYMRELTARVSASGLASGFKMLATNLDPRDKKVVIEFESKDPSSNEIVELTMDEVSRLEPKDLTHVIRESLRC